MPLRPRAVFALAAAALVALSGCSSAEDTDSPAPGEGISITHAFGETQIPQGVERIATLGWGSADAALALGVVPVAMEAQSYGGNDEGVLPWNAERLEQLGADTPIIFPSTTEEPAYEEIAAAAPELILAPYSGISEEQYELLNEIAPTVAYPDAPWTTPWREVVSIVGTALDKEQEAADLLSDIDSLLNTTAAEHPEFAGLSVAAVWDVAGTFYVYRAADPRVEFLFDLGFVNAPAVDDLANGESSFFYTLSYEQLDALESDVLVSYHDTEAAAETFLGQAYAGAIPAVKNGSVASIVGTQLVAAVSPPTALSLPWGLDDYVAALAQAAAE